MSDDNEPVHFSRDEEIILAVGGFLTLGSLMAMSIEQIYSHTSAKKYGLATNNTEKIAALKSEKIAILHGIVAAIVLLLIILVNFLYTFASIRKKGLRKVKWRSGFVLSLIFAMTVLLIISIYSKLRLHGAINKKIDELNSGKSSSDLDTQIKNDTTWATSTTMLFLLIIIISITLSMLTVAFGRPQGGVDTLIDGYAFLMFAKILGYAIIGFIQAGMGAGK